MEADYERIRGAITEANLAIFAQNNNWIYILIMGAHVMKLWRNFQAYFKVEKRSMFFMKLEISFFIDVFLV